MKKVSFYTLGCKVNAYDSTAMQALFVQSGFEIARFGEKTDIVVVNTCTITSVADKKSRSIIRRAADLGRVIVTGCLVQRDAESVMRIEGVAAAIGTQDRVRIVEIALRLLEGESGIDITCSLDGCAFETIGAAGNISRTRGILKIQEGCNCFCSYCIIPYVRGRSRSRNFDDALAEAHLFAQNDIKEIILTGIHLTSYNYKGKLLGDLIEQLAHIKGVRIRLGSLEPGNFKFLEKASGAANLCEHFHISLQSGSEEVLGNMNRKYTPNDFLSYINDIRNAFVTPAITTDIIAGFPKETDKQHKETLNFVEKAAFSRIHVFPFSAREKTQAYGLKPRVPKKITKERVRELILLGEKLESEYINSLIGMREQIIFETPSKNFEGCLEGYGRRYVRVAARAKTNELKEITLIKKLENVVFGE